MRMGSCAPFLSSLASAGRCVNMPTRVMSAGSAASSNSNARTSVYTNAFNLGGHRQLKRAAYIARWRDVRNDREAVADAGAGASDKRQQVAPHTRDARDRLWEVIPSLRLKLERVLSPKLLRAINRQDGDEDRSALRDSARERTMRSVPLHIRRHSDGSRSGREDITDLIPSCTCP